MKRLLTRTTLEAARLPGLSRIQVYGHPDGSIRAETPRGVIDLGSLHDCFTKDQPISGDVWIHESVFQHTMTRLLRHTKRQP